jgi:hypothetical protein
LLLTGQLYPAGEDPSAASMLAPEGVLFASGSLAGTFFSSKRICRQGGA